MLTNTHDAHNIDIFYVDKVRESIQRVDWADE